MPVRRSLRTAFLLAACTALGCPALRADLGFIPLGGLPGGSGASQALAISADGLTVVGHASSAVSTEEAFVWTATGGMNGLGDLPGGSAISRATAVSTDGSVVVGNGTVASGFQEGFRWTQAGGLVSIGDLPGGILYSNAAGVSADGSVVVGSGYNSANRNEGLQWTAATGATGIGFFTEGGFTGTSSTVFGSSADGSVLVGRATLPSGFTRAFRYTAATGLLDLNVFPGGDQSIAYATSADGSVVVGFGNFGEFNKEAFRWTAATGLVSLGDLPGGAIRSEALAVSADGSVVVGVAEGATFSDGAFVWDASNGIRSIRDLLTAAGLAPGWSISAATGVSGDGRRIVGYGSKDGTQQAWLLDFDAPPPPPPPAPTMVLAWTEDLPQTVAFKSNAVLRLGYDNGTGIIDIATQTAGNAGFNGVEYADGLLLVANQGAGTGTRIHDPRYAPLIVNNLNAYDLHATPGYLWQATGGANRLYKLAQSGGFITNGTVIDRTFTTLINRNASRFINAVHSDGITTFFSSTSNPAGLYRRSAEALFDPAAIHTAGSPAVYDFEVVGDQIYFTDINANTIQRIKTDGTGLVTLVSNAMFANGIAVTDTHIYWSEFTTGLIRRANLDGSGSVTLIEGRTGLRGVAVLPLSIIDGPAPQGVAFNDLPVTYDGAINTPVALSLASTSGLPVSLEIISGPATVSGNTITYVGSGPVMIRATQAGNASFAPASLISTVNAAPRLGQTITFAQPANLIYAGTPVTFPLSATASSGLPVELVVTNGPATYDSVAQALTVTGVGSITIFAVQNGDSTYAPADYVERTFTASAPGAASPLDAYLTAAGVPVDQRGPLDDPDGDGISNLLEFALDLSPVNATPGALPAAVAEGGFLQLTYARARPADLSYVVETTTDLDAPASWTPVGVTQGTPDVDGRTTASIPLDGPRRFLRLRATLIAP